MTGPFVYSCQATKGTRDVAAVEGSAGNNPDDPHIVTHADRHEEFLRWVSLYMLTVTVNSAQNKLGRGKRKNAQSIRTATNTRMEK